MEDLDAVMRSLIEAAFCGVELLEHAVVESGAKRGHELRWIGVDDDVAEGLDRYFEPAAHEAKGAWYLPDDGAPVKPGRINAAFILSTAPDVAMRFIDWERAWVYPHRDSCALAIWSVLGPLMDGLITPLDQRAGSFLGARESDIGARTWRQALGLYDALGIDRAAVEFWLSGQRLLQAPREDHIQAREVLGAAWAVAASAASDRYRAHRLRTLVCRYYEKAKDGKATRRQVLTGPTGRTLSAYFSGDWLAFLKYIGEEPHPREQIVRAIPAVRIVSPDLEQAASVAKAAGIDASQIETILATFWGSADAQGPLLRRERIMKRFWTCFEDAWARQKADDLSLYWLVADTAPGRGSRAPDELSADIGDGHSPFIAERVLPADLLEAIRDQWATVTSASSPDRRGSCVDAEAAFVAAFGPALRFWHAVATTAWDTTVLGDLSGFHDETGPGRRINDAARELSALGAPPPALLLSELRDLQDQLPEVTYAWESNTEALDDMDLDHTEFESPWSTPMPVEYEVRPGASITRHSHSSSSRPGWEEMRSIITRHRSAWAAANLDTYLRRRWEEPLRSFGEWWYRRLADRGGRAPTKRQIGEKAERLANDWFGGDTVTLCRTLQIAAPFHVETKRLLPEDRRGFIERVLRELGGTWWYERRPNPEDHQPNIDDENWEQEDHAQGLEQLALDAPSEVVQWELNGTRSRPGMEYYAEHLAKALRASVDDALRIYGDAICRALVASGVDRSSIPESHAALGSEDA